MHEYDLVVIGSGPTGQRAALTVAAHGKHVAVVERHAEVGGGSLRGTIPSKTKHECAGRAASCRRCRSIPSCNGFVSPGFGMVVSQSPHLIRWKGEVEADMNMKKTVSIALLCGTASLTGPASSQPSETTAYHYVLPLVLALEAATEAVRAYEVCAHAGVAKVADRLPN
jgi:pyruvate/2-oxoglutarate dehydrogenase complex dihydrolipoamide dehydrogenase (E3) component